MSEFEDRAKCLLSGIGIGKQLVDLTEGYFPMAHREFELYPGGAPKGFSVRDGISESMDLLVEYLERAEAEGCSVPSEVSGSIREGVRIWKNDPFSKETVDAVDDAMLPARTSPG